MRSFETTLDLNLQVAEKQRIVKQSRSIKERLSIILISKRDTFWIQKVSRLSFQFGKKKAASFWMRPLANNKS
jgi:hypothetical protein